MNEHTNLLEIKDLTVHYVTVDGTVHAVENLNLTLPEGKTLGLVGETGAGKTTTVKAIMQILPDPPAKILTGEVIFCGEDLLKKNKKSMRKIRGKQISMIFQDSGAMMNPTRKIGAVFTEYLQTHEKISKKDAWAKGEEMLEKMRLPSPDNIMRSYPFQLSGGMRQRVGIAMGMTYQPKLLLADEPTSALDVTTQAQIVRLDVTIQAQILDIMRRLKGASGSLMLITHNLGVAAYMSDYIVVMKDGHIEDQGDRDHILHHSENDYTRRLLSAVPSMGGESYV